MRPALAFAALCFALAPAYARADEPCLPLPGEQTSFADISTQEPARAFAGDRELGETPIAGAKLPLGCSLLRFEPIDGAASQMVSVEVKAERNKNRFIYSLADGAKPIEHLPGTTFLHDIKLIAPSSKQALCSINAFVLHARDALVSGRYEAASRHLMSAKAFSDSCGSDLQRLHILDGILRAAQDDKRSDTSFELALAIDPSFTLPKDIFPRALRSFERAQRATAERKPLHIEVTKVEHREDRAALVVWVKSVDAMRIGWKLIAFVRRPGDPQYFRFEERVYVNLETALEIPVMSVPEDAPEHLEYFVVLTDEKGGRLTNAGRADAPLKLPLP